MNKDISRKIVSLLSNNKRSLLPSYNIEEYIKGNKPLSSFHQWADDRPHNGAFLIRDSKKIARWILLIDWHDNHRYYIVLFPEARTKPIAEIHKVISHGNGEELRWTYKPMKQGGKNEQRKEYFKKYFYDTEVRMSIPSYSDELSDFVSELFSLAESRIKADELDENPPDYREGFPEGRLYQRLHFARERNLNVVRIAKQIALKKHGRLSCQICGFDFKENYGELGDGFIEAHHTIPVSELKEGEETKVEDMALVCSNCHQMLHRKRPWLTIEKLSKIISRI